MNLDLAILCGGGIGLALLLFGLAFVRPRTDLAAAVGRWEAQRQYKPTPTVSETAADLQARMGAYLVRELRQRGISMSKLRADLELLDKTLEQHLTNKVLLAVFGLVLPSLANAALSISGVNLPWSVPLVVGLVLAGVFFLVPDLSVAQEASARRDDLRRALSCFLDLVSMALNAGRGVSDALPLAAGIGQGRGFELISETISRSRYAGITPWAALSDLGERVDLPELRDLGGALTLVADDGAKVRQSLTARAATQRRRQLAEAESEAEKSEQSINLAQVILAVGFLLFLAYPAVINILNL
jgi:tight adherence protein C